MTNKIHDQYSYTINVELTFLFVESNAMEKIQKRRISAHLLAFNSNSFSKLLSDTGNWFLLGVTICPPTLNRLSTVAEDGSFVFFCIEFCEYCFHDWIHVQHHYRAIWVCQIILRLVSQQKLTDLTANDKCHSVLILLHLATTFNGLTSSCQQILTTVDDK